MQKPYRVLHYVNQFFGQLGGEESAFVEPSIKEGPVGPGLAFASALGSDYDIVATVICGDNYIAQNTEEAAQRILRLAKPYKPDLLLAGPAFNAGRYGPACGAVCKTLGTALGIPVITGMFEENPGVELYRRDCYIVKTKNSAVGMRDAVSAMSLLAHKLIAGEEPAAQEDHYFPRGIMRNVFVDQTGAERAVKMLLAKLAGQEYHSELVLTPFETVQPAPPITDLSGSTLALVTDAGLTDKQNSFHLESARATKYIDLDIGDLDTLSPDQFCSVHGGFDPSFANTRPDVLVPLDILRELQKAGCFASLHETLYSTTGNGTTLKNARKYGEEIAQKLLHAGVNGVLLTST